jgi:hypothetical protein
MKWLAWMLFVLAPAYGAQCDSSGTRGKLLHSDDFSNGLKQWVTEFKAAPGSTIAVRDGKLVIDTAGGATAWFHQPLSGNFLITYSRMVVMGEGRNDRLSDLNQFWMATDPLNPNLFTRSGVFEEYDALRMYYAGIGGNTNTTSRFRKYMGDGQRVLLTDLKDQAYLLAPNKRVEVQTAVYKGCTQVTVDGKIYFSYQDPDPLRQGYFGFRTTQSRHEIDDLKIYRLD